MNTSDARQAEPTYRIGAVSRLTGVAPDTLRVWERRYGAVVPLRSEKGSRLYSQNDVGRLALIKRLVDSGDAISRVANLDKAELADVAGQNAWRGGEGRIQTGVEPRNGGAQGRALTLL